MTDREFRRLQVGDIVRHKNSSSALVVTACYGDRVTAVKTHDLTNPSEWDFISGAKHTCPTEHDGTFEQPPVDFSDFPDPRR